MSIKAKIQSIRIGLKVGVKATDALLKLVGRLEKEKERLEKETESILRDIAEIKEITPDDEEEPETK